MSNVLTIPTSGTIIFSSDTPGSSFASPLSTSPRISYDNAGGINITSYTTATSALDRLSIDGTAGRLFSVSDALTGTIFTVNDISGLPIIKVDSNIVDVITMGAPNTNTFVISNTSVGIGTTTPNERLTVIGNISASGIIYGNGSGLTNIGSVGGAYLPLSGGTLTGSLTANNNILIVGTLSASQYLGLSIPSGNYLPLSGGIVTGTTSFQGTVSSTAVIYASGGNSDLWNSVYSTVSSTSANWSNVYTTTNSNSANWNSVYTNVNSNSANWLNTYSTVSSTSANWSDVYTTVQTSSAGWGIDSSGGAYLPLSGGTLTGSLTANNNVLILGTLSASQYLGIPTSSGSGGDYLPLSGGTLTGNLSASNIVISGTLSTSQITSQFTDGSIFFVNGVTNLVTISPTVTKISNPTKIERAVLVSNSNADITLIADDAGTIINCTLGTPITIKLPATTMVTGYNLMVIQSGAGTIRFNANGNTLNSFGGLLSTAGIHSAVSLVCTASATYNLAGNLI